MEFRSLSRLNMFVNVFSGNLLPVTSKETKVSTVLKIYSIILWGIVLSYLVSCIAGIFYVPKDRALKDSTVNIVVSLEMTLLVLYLHIRKNLLRGLIEKLNNVLGINDQILRNTTIQTVKPLDKPLKLYMIASVSSVITWMSLPLIKIFQQKEFYNEDYQVPAAFSREPFSIGVFIGGAILELVGATFVIVKKISLDLYMMHFILLLTAQYRYLRMKLTSILRNYHAHCKNNLNSTDSWENVCCEHEKVITQEMRLLTRHHGTVVEMAVMLKKLLSPSIGILYINNVFRFCFLSFMIATCSTVHFELFLILLYIIGALIQLYILCFCIQQLLEASTAVIHDAFHESWYIHNKPLQHVIAMMTLTNKLECRISNFRNIDLSLPSFMSILNQAYSVCLLFLKARRV